VNYLELEITSMTGNHPQPHSSRSKFYSPLHIFWYFSNLV